MYSSDTLICYKPLSRAEKGVELVRTHYGPILVKTVRVKILTGAGGKFSQTLKMKKNDETIFLNLEIKNPFDL